MKGWFVDKDDGTPLAFTKEADRPDLAAIHPYITDPMPYVDNKPYHAPHLGRFAKWTIGGWTVDTVAEQAWEDARDAKAQRKVDAKQAFIDLRDFDHTSVDWTNPTQVRMAFEYQRVRLLKMFRYMASQLG